MRVDFDDTELKVTSYNRDNYKGNLLLKTDGQSHVVAKFYAYDRDTYSDSQGALTHTDIAALVETGRCLPDPWSRDNFTCVREVVECVVSQLEELCGKKGTTLEPYYMGQLYVSKRSKEDKKQELRRTGSVRRRYGDSTLDDLCECELFL